MALQSQSQRVSRYEIVRKLGEGGMGVVYQARDSDLGRFVALKFLSSHLLDSPERIARFRQEARAISALNHPRIATIYGIEDSGDQKFLVLEYLPGGTLRQKLLLARSAGVLPPLAECVQWAIQIAEGLAHAHDHGIIHRDIKSSNVLFTEDGNIKIADFGLAKFSPGAQRPDAEQVSTASGNAMGTPVYMSPEQARGQEVDERSDIFSLGILLFELIAGQMPFRNTDTPAVLHDIVYTPAPPLAAFRDGVPQGLQDIVSRMLEKDPAARYQTARELVADLKALAATLDSRATPSALETVTLQHQPRSKHRRRILAFGAVAAGLALGGALPPVWHAVAARILPKPLPAHKRVAVLRFANIGGDPANQTLCDGLFEVVSNALSQLESFEGTLLVVPAADVRKESVSSVREAGLSLGANLAVTGSVQRLDANRVQVMISLSDTRTVTQLRSETIRAALPDLAAVQDEAAGKVARMLEIVLQPRAAQTLKAGNTLVPAAYPLYVEGLGYLRRYDQPENIAKAIGAFEGAVARDRNYALAYAGLAEADKRQYDVLKEARYIDDALENCSRSLALSDKQAASHITMGMIRASKGEYARAEKEFQAALAIDAFSGDAYRELASIYDAMGRDDRAEATYRRAIELRRDDWSSEKQLGVFYFNHGRLPEAEQCFREVIRLTPDSGKAHSNLGGLYFKMGRYADAIAQLRKSLELSPTSDGYDNLGGFYYYQGDYTQAAVQFRRAINMAPERSDFWGNLADAYRWNPAQAAQAPETYRRAIELANRQVAVNPRDGQLHSQLATWWMALGDRKQAAREIASALQLAPRDGDVQFDAAVVYEQSGQRDRALRAAAVALAAGYPADEFRRAPTLKAFCQDPRYQRLAGPHDPAQPNKEN